MELALKAVDLLKDKMEDITFPQFYAIFIWTVLLIFLGVLAAVHGRSIISGLKGPDGTWDSKEIFIALYIVCFPFIMFTAVPLQVPIPDGIYATMDIIGTVILLGKSYIEAKKLSQQPRV